MALLMVTDLLTDGPKGNGTKWETTDLGWTGRNETMITFFFCIASWSMTL